MPRGKFLTGQNSRLQTFAGPCFSKSPKPSRPQTQRKPQTTKSGNTTPEPAARDTTSRPSKTRTEIDEPHTSPTAPIKRKLQVNLLHHQKQHQQRPGERLHRKQLGKQRNLQVSFCSNYRKRSQAFFPRRKFRTPHTVTSTTHKVSNQKSRQPGTNKSC